MIHGLQLAVHFVCAQCQGILLFYVGLRSYLALSANWTATHLLIDHNGNSEWKNYATLGEVLDCVLGDAYTMIMSFDPGYAPQCVGPQLPASMYGFSSTTYNVVVSSVNVTGLLLVTIFVLVLLNDLRQSGATNIGQGKYLAFTYRVQQTSTFKTLSRILVAFACLIVLDTCRFMEFLYNNGYAGYLTNYAEFLLPTLLTLAYSAYSLGSNKVDPFFNYETDQFQALQFSRGWGDVVTDNNAFAQTLGLGLLAFKRGSDTPLKNLLSEKFAPACSSPKDVAKVCDLPSEKDPLAGKA